MLLPQSVQVSICVYIAKDVYKLFLAAVVELTSETSIANTVLRLVTTLICEGYFPRIELLN